MSDTDIRHFHLNFNDDSEYPTIIGTGGTKTIYQVSDSICIALPNLTDGPALRHAWPRIVSEEIQISKTFDRLGLLHPDINPCQVTIPGIKEHEPASTLDTFYMPTFSSLVDNNIYVLDGKIRTSSTLPKDITIMSEDQMDDIDEWLKIFMPLFDDIKIMCKDGIYATGDRKNLAVIRNDDQSYSIRFFGFDFTSKYTKFQGFNGKLSFTKLVHMTKGLVDLAISSLINDNDTYNKYRNKYLEVAQAAVDRDLLGDHFIVDDSYQTRDVTMITDNSSGCNLM